MVGGGHRIGFTRPARRVLAPRVADPGVDPRFVVRRPEANAVAEPPRDHRRILPKRFSGGAYRPTTCILEGLRRIPVEERRERLEILGEQLVDKTIVEV